MRGIDTPVLLAFLRGRKGARAELKRLVGEELATTEWNLFELECFANAAGAPGVEKRRAALEKLRRRLTVVPLDATATLRAAGWVATRKGRPSPSWLMLAAAEASGCTEWITTRDAMPALPPMRMKLRTIGNT